MLWQSVCYSRLPLHLTDRHASLAMTLVFSDGITFIHFVVIAKKQGEGLVAVVFCGNLFASPVIAKHYQDGLWDGMLWQSVN